MGRRSPAAIGGGRVRVYANRPPDRTPGRHFTRAFCIDGRSGGASKWADVHQPEKLGGARAGRGWRHRGPGSRSRGVDAGRAAASSVARARGRQALKRGSKKTRLSRVSTRDTILAARSAAGFGSSPTCSVLVHGRVGRISPICQEGVK